MSTSHGKPLQSIRWAVRGVLALGVAASVTANVLHAHDNPISQTIAAWPPLALLITIELVSRVPVHRTWLANIRRAGTTVIAAIAAWVSYWHMVGVAGRYGESAVSAHLLPFSVDGLVVIASVSLVELAGRIRALADEIAEHLKAQPPEVEEQPEPVADDASSDTPAEPHPTAIKIAALRKRYPRITQQKAAQRLELGLRTVQRHWPDAVLADASPAASEQPNVERINGHTPELEAARG